MKVMLSIGSFIALTALCSVFIKKDKETVDPAAKQNCTPVGWKGAVALHDRKAGHDSYLLPESAILQEGYVEVEQEFTSDYRFWTGIQLDIPCGKNIDADNVRLEWFAKSNISVGTDEADLGAALTGENATAYVNAVRYRPEYNQMSFGKKLIKNVTEIYPTPQKWTTYAVEVTGRKLNFYIDGKLKKSLAGNESLGMLKQLKIHFKGSGRIDWMKLYEGNKLVIEDNFDKAGKSTLRWLK